MTLTANVVRSAFVGIDTTAIVSGVLPVARGGTGTDTSTGMGNVVLSNAPTLSNVSLSGTFNIANITGPKTGTGNLVLSDAPTLYGNVTMPGNLSAKGVIKNVYHQANTTSFTTGTTFIDGPVWDAVNISANSKVRVYVYIPWRNQNGSGTYGGFYVDVQFRVNQNVGTYIANSWVTLGTSGFQMITNVDEMLQHTNELYLPFSITTDFTLQFKYRFAAYDGTVVVSNHNASLGDVLLTQFGISREQYYPKIIITEIGG